MSDSPVACVTPPLVTKIVSSYVRKNHVLPADMSALINAVHRSLVSLGKPAQPERSETPAVPIRRSVTPNYVVCLKCGWRGKMLRRHLHSHGLSADRYRARWKLSPKHPLTAPAYSQQRSAFAKQSGLGQARRSRRRQRRTPA
jgi:predicted transcriptional regulator